MEFFREAQIKQPACSIYGLIFGVKKVQLNEIDASRLHALGITEKADVDAILKHSNVVIGGGQQEANMMNRANHGMMKDLYKLALFDTHLIDPDIIREKCELYGSVKHCRRFNGITFPLFCHRR